ncbi:uncharacterized protein [Macaca fascicularis]|uniref:uncharacterized protein n=1 Tax=Macaca fascicularis TaxID=9541 RepID=UPI003D1566AD
MYFSSTTLGHVQVALQAQGEQLSPPPNTETGAGPARQVKVLWGPRRPACAQTPAPPPPGGKDPAGLPGPATPAAHGASAGRSSPSWGRGRPRGEGGGEGRPRQRQRPGRRSAAPPPLCGPGPGGAPPKPREEAGEPSLRPRTAQRRHGTWESLCALLRATATRRGDSEPAPGPARNRHARWCRGVGKLITSRKQRERAPQELERKQPKTRKGAGRTAALEADVTSTAHLPKITEGKPQRMPTTIVNGCPPPPSTRSYSAVKLPDGSGLSFPHSHVSVPYVPHFYKLSPPDSLPINLISPQNIKPPSFKACIIYGSIST